MLLGLEQKILVGGCKSHSIGTIRFRHACRKPQRLVAQNASTEVLTVDSISPDMIKRYRTQDKKKAQAGSEPGKVVLSLKGVTKSYRDRDVLTNATWDVRENERVGLVGWNGAGKTTQLQIIVGELEADSGEVWMQDGLRLAYLNQEFDVDFSHTVWEEFMTVYDEINRILARPDELQDQLETMSESTPEEVNLVLEELERARKQQEAVQAQNLTKEVLEERIREMMPQLGFKEADVDLKVRAFSGGWQMRMCLGKILLQQPELLLLDEPTNHLDLQAITWLENYLKRLSIPMVIVSHDREFLNQLATKIVDTDEGVTTTYQGNYRTAMRRKKTNQARLTLEWEKQQKEIARLKDIIGRLGAGNQAGRAQQAQKELDKLLQDPIQRPRDVLKRYFTFPPVGSMSGTVLKLDKVTHGYPGRPLFSKLNLEVYRGDKIAIIGPNGAGKSTLLRIMMLREEPNEGTVTVGDNNVVANYFEQNQAEALDLELTALDTVQEVSEEADETEVKALLGRLAFKGTDVEKQVEVLSGGEKARVALARFMMTRGTLLVLDEPTNHLDIPTKEVLEEAVQKFAGTVIAVSHDRYFLRQVCTRVLQIEDQKVTDYRGDYDYYLMRNEKEAAFMDAKETRARSLAGGAKDKLSKAEVKLQERSIAQLAKQGRAPGEQKVGMRDAKLASKRHEFRQQKRGHTLKMTKKQRRQLFGD